MVAITKHNMFFHEKFLDAKNGAFSSLLLKGAKIVALPLQSLKINLAHRRATRKYSYVFAKFRQVRQLKSSKLY